MVLSRPSNAGADVVARPGTRLLSASVDVQTPAERVFELLCAIEKWPVWLSFLRSAEVIGSGIPIRIGSDVLLRSAIPSHDEQLFEVDHFITNHHLSLVGAYSLRRRVDFRIERKTTRCRVHARLEYPAYGGTLGALYDALRSARKLAVQLEESLQHFKHLAEYNPTPKDELLADF
jgi:uncharacterized membrane protein